MEKGKNIKNTYPVLGMSCASCAARVDKTLNGLPGVYQATVNYATAVAQVEYNPKVCSDATLQSAVQDAGYDLLVDTGEDVADKSGRNSVDKIPEDKKAYSGSPAVISPNYGYQYVF